MEPRINKKIENQNNSIIVFNQNTVSVIMKHEMPYLGPLICLGIISLHCLHGQEGATTHLKADSPPPSPPFTDTQTHLVLS